MYANLNPIANPTPVIELSTRRRDGVSLVGCTNGYSNILLLKEKKK